MTHTQQCSFSGGAKCICSDEKYNCLVDHHGAPCHGFNHPSPKTECTHPMACNYCIERIRGFERQVMAHQKEESILISERKKAEEMVKIARELFIEILKDLQEQTDPIMITIICQDALVKLEGK